MGDFPRSAQSPFRNTNARGKLTAGILIPGLLVFGLSSTSCHKKTPAQVQNNRSVAPAQTANPPSPSAEKQSCKTFVQSFYDWYWNRYAQSANSVGFDMHSLPNVETVLKRKPSVLSPELSRLLSDDEKKMSATRQTGNLDFDPFGGNQDAQGQYVVDRVSVNGDRCKASIPQGDEIVELQRSGSSWVFVNFYYCFTAYDSTVGRRCPDTDLVQILKK